MLTLNIPYPLVQKYFQWKWHPSWCNYRNVLANTWETTTYLSKYQKKSTVRCVTFEIVRHPFEKSLIFLSIIQPVKSVGYNFTYLQTYRNTLSGHLRELKNNGKVQLRELFITKYESVQTRFYKGDRNQSGRKENFDCTPFGRGIPVGCMRKSALFTRKKKSRLP